MKSLAMCASACLLMLPIGYVSHPATPDAASAQAADEAINHMLLTNDADGLGRLLADDWVVVSAYGAVADRDGFLQVIKAGVFTRTTMDLSEPRVKIYGNTAVVTTRLHTVGHIQDRAFDVPERQTDVLVWRDGRWQSVLLHETFVHEK